MEIKLFDYEDGKLYYNGEQVIFFDAETETEDGRAYAFCYIDEDGTLAVETVRDDAVIENAISDVTGLKVLTEEKTEQKKSELGL